MGMGVAVPFGGYELTIPGFYGKREYIDEGSNLGELGNILFYVGESEIGIPYSATDFDGSALRAGQKVNVIKTPNDPANKLRSDTLYDACRFGLNPSTDSTIQGAPQINCISVNPKTRSSRTLSNGATPVITIYSTNFGVPMNHWACKVSTGTTAGTKKLNILFEQQLYEKDDIERKCFTVENSGATTATITITGSSSGAVQTTVNGLPSINKSFLELETVGQLVDYINNQAGYVATLLTDPDYPTNRLDEITNEDIKNASYTVKADCYAMIEWINSSLGDSLYAINPGGGSKKVADNDSIYVYFTGGTQTAATNTDWANAAAMLEKLNSDFISVLSGDSTIMGYFKTHATYMSSIPGRSERTAGGGATLTDTSATILTKLQALASADFAFCATRIKQNDDTGVLTSYAGYYATAMIFSMLCGNGVDFPLPLKELAILGLVDDYAPDDIDLLIRERAIVIAETSQGGAYAIQRGLTTSMSSMLSQISLEGMRLSKYITKDSRALLQEKQRNLKKLLNDKVKESFDSELLQVIFPRYQELGYITDDPTTGAKAIQNFKSSIVGNKYQYECLITIPLPLEFGLGLYQFRIVGGN